MTHPPAATLGRLLLVCFALALLSAGCAPNPGFCCLALDEDSCLDPGLGGWDPTVTACTDPARPYCDDDGEYGLKHTCIPDPIAVPCSEPVECPDERPVCVDEFCRECATSAECPAPRPVCGPETYMCGPCETNEDCAGWTDPPRCLTDTGACVQCLGADDCDGATPVCEDNACRACRGHEECASDACDRETGVCLDEADVIYLTETGVDGPCTREAPCGTFEQGLGEVTGERAVIKVAPGTYTGPVEIDGIAVTILAEDATAEPALANENVVAVLDGANATIEGLTITGASGTSNPVGIACTSLTSTLRLRGSTVINNTSGVRVTGCQFSLVNNVIAFNGSLTSAFGGVRIEDITAGGVHELAFNTISRNGGANGVITGVQCVSITTSLEFSNNIIYGNNGTTGQAGDDPQCTWTFSDIGPEPVGGNGNLNMDPIFVDPDSFDFHIEPSSPAKNTADPAATLARDIDNEDRPQGGRSDIGADEAP